jgi:tRNA (cytidine56-2'-O)-methyltransferase
LGDVWVLRLTHRPYRDKRLSTHVCLAARAFGSEGIFIHGPRDKSIEEGMERLKESWGGDFSVRFVADYMKVIKKWRWEGGMVVHLTMKGERIKSRMDEIRRSDADKLVVVGSKKVPGEVYASADFNLSVGDQPHSEVSALAVFLDRLFQGRELSREPDLKGAKAA